MDRAQRRSKEYEERTHYYHRHSSNNKNDKGRKSYESHEEHRRTSHDHDQRHSHHKDRDSFSELEGEDDHQKRHSRNKDDHRRSFDNESGHHRYSDRRNSHEEEHRRNSHEEEHRRESTNKHRNSSDSERGHRNSFSVQDWLTYSENDGGIRYSENGRGLRYSENEREKRNSFGFQDLQQYRRDSIDKKSQEEFIPLVVTVPLPRDDGTMSKHPMHIQLPVPQRPPGANGPQLQEIHPLKENYKGRHNERWYFFWPPEKHKSEKHKHNKQIIVDTQTESSTNDFGNNKKKPPTTMTVEKQLQTQKPMENEITQQTPIEFPNKIDDVKRYPEPMGPATCNDYRLQRYPKESTLFEESIIGADNRSNYPEPEASVISNFVESERGPYPAQYRYPDQDDDNFPTTEINPNRNICERCGIGRFRKKTTILGYIAAVLLFPCGTYVCMTKKGCVNEICNYCGHIKPKEKKDMKNTDQ